MTTYQWQPIETAPKDGEPVDLWESHFGGQRFPDCRWKDDAWRRWSCYLEGWEKIDIAFTHWMRVGPPEGTP